MVYQFYAVSPRQACPAPPRPAPKSLSLGAYAQQQQQQQAQQSQLRRPLRSLFKRFQSPPPEPPTESAKASQPFGALMAGSTGSLPPPSSLPKPRRSRGPQAAPGQFLSSHSASSSNSEVAKPRSPLDALAALQTFDGGWVWSAELEGVLGTTRAAAAAAAQAAGVAAAPDALATLCAVLFFKHKLAGDEDAWEMMVDKARDWLADSLGATLAAAEQALAPLFAK